jgi:predicted PurR-regulated permease PerM
MKFERLMEQLVGIFALVVLIGGALLVVAPFVTALLWGAILAYSTWGPYQRLTAALGGRRAWGTLLMVLLILCLLLGPVFYASFAFAAHIDELVAFVRQRFAGGLPALPEWLVGLPFVGPRVEEVWAEIGARNPAMVARIREFAGVLTRTGFATALAVMQGLGQLALSVLFAAFFYLGGQNAASGLLAGMKRIAGARGPYLLALVGNTAKGVVYGILGTSLVQAVLCGVGYWIAGLPSPVLLALVTFFLAVIPGGPMIVIVPGVIWLAQNGHTGLAVFLAVWSVVVSILTDNVLKPVLIGKSSHVPFILVMIGVLGGALTFGFLGVFIGPTLLAVADAVLRDWVRGEPGPNQAEAVPVEGVRLAP